MTPRTIISAGLIAALPLALAGCSSSKSGSGTAGTGGPAAVTSPATAPSTQLTGTQLAGALLSGSDIGSGFTSDKSSAVDSGGSLTTAAAKFKPAAISCADLLNDLGEAGFGESAMADDSVPNNTTGELVNEVVYQFSSASAANVFFTSLEAKWNSCGSFTESDPSSGKSGKVSIVTQSAPAGLGDMAFANSMSVSMGSVSLSGVNLAVLKGVDVFVVAPGKMGGGQPTDLSAQSLMEKLMAKVAALG
jgi:hypothetical protein